MAAVWAFNKRRSYGGADCLMRFGWRASRCGGSPRLEDEAPPLYWHFPDKQALLDGMAVPFSAPCRCGTQGEDLG